MSLLERIREDQATLRKQRDKVAANALDVVLAGIARRAKAITPRRALTDGEVVGVVRAAIRRIDKLLAAIGDDIDQQERVDRLLIERHILVEYLPQPLTDNELATIAMRQHSIMNQSQIMTFLRQYYTGRYDPARATEIVRSVTT